MITVLGGVCCKPMALLKREKTTTMRVKEVTTTRIPGARLRIVKRAIMRKS